MKSFTLENKTVEIWPAREPGRPVIYLNTFAGEGSRIYELLRQKDCGAFTLVAVSGLLWDHDMSPWAIPPISRDDTPCTGGADDYLQLLTEKILPRAEEEIPGGISWRGLTGYSLAGLFAVYAIYRTDLFSRIASMSGSLWFPGIREYLQSHEPARKPDCMYFSLGSKECRTRNRYLQCVQQNTTAIESFFREQGVDTQFRLHPGNHYQDAPERTAAGLAWILSR